MGQKGYFVVYFLAAAVVLALFILVLISLSYLFSEDKIRGYTVEMGVSFSPHTATYLSSDWKKVYMRILNELKVRRIRIPTYWEDIEPQDGIFDFSSVDFMVDIASQNGASIILMLGQKQPRWPECHTPDWAKNLSLELKKRKTLNLIQAIVERYGGNSNVWAWQVENEPFFKFGEDCATLDRDFVRQEIFQIRISDTTKPIIVTDTGEWGAWISAAGLSDILGISVYNKSYNPRLGYINLPFPTFYYQFKSSLARSFAPNNKYTIITELQAEPWVKESFKDTPIDTQLKLFKLADFKNRVKFGQTLGFKQAYFWGVEWWYFVKELGYPEYWDYAKTIF